MATIYQETLGRSVSVVSGKGPSREAIFDILRICDQNCPLSFVVEWMDIGGCQNRVLSLRLSSIEVLKREWRHGGNVLRLRGWDKEDRCGVRIDFDVIARTGPVVFLEKPELLFDPSVNQGITVVNTPSREAFFDFLRAGGRDNMNVEALAGTVGYLVPKGIERLSVSRYGQRWFIWGTMLAADDKRRFIMHLDTEHRAGTFKHIG